jgi:hypothetical protein
VLGRQMVCGQFGKRLGHPSDCQDRCLLRGAASCLPSSGVPEEVLAEPVSNSYGSHGRFGKAISHHILGGGIAIEGPSSS